MISDKIVTNGDSIAKARSSIGKIHISSANIYPTTMMTETMAKDVINNLLARLVIASGFLYFAKSKSRKFQMQIMLTMG